MAQTYLVSSDAPGGLVVAESDVAAMGEALRLAGRCAVSGDVPVGALVLGPDGSVLGRGRNLREAQADPTAHAEIVALRQAAAALGTWRLDGCTLVVTLEPCLMCAGALLQARVDRLVYGAWDPKAGACGSVWDVLRDRQALHRPEVVAGVCEQACATLLADFFRGRRTGGRTGGHTGSRTGGRPAEGRVAGDASGSAAPEDPVAQPADGGEEPPAEPVDEVR